MRSRKPFDWYKSLLFYILSVIVFWITFKVMGPP